MTRFEKIVILCASVLLLTVSVFGWEILSTLRDIESVLYSIDVHIER